MTVDTLRIYNILHIILDLQTLLSRKHPGGPVPSATHRTGTRLRD